MGSEQSTLKKNGYAIEKETENAVFATKEDEKFFIKKIHLRQKSRNDVSTLTSEIETFKKTSHPHIVSIKNSFEDQNTYYIVMDYCHGKSLAAKIREMSQPPKESEVLSWIVEICMALRTIHGKDLHHKHLTPENIFLTEFGTVCLEEFGTIHENSKTTNSNLPETNYMAPEVFTDVTYDAKSDIWSVGCILYELCTRQPAFSAETMVKLLPKITGGHYPSLPEQFSPELRVLLHDIFKKDPQLRPTASAILGRPFIISCLLTKVWLGALTTSNNDVMGSWSTPVHYFSKCKTTVKELQTRLNELRTVADSLERVHQGTTIGSLAGGVIGAVGGITSIVGLILAPFTLGASLIVTGIGVGVGAVGGVTAGASNITNMVNQSSDRKAVRSIIKELEQKIYAVVTWLQEISNSLQTLRSRCDTLDIEDSMSSEDNLFRLGCRAGKGLGGIAELLRLVQVMNIGKIAAQASRVVRVAEVATGVLSGLFVAVDIFFIAMDAKEIHHIRQAKATEEGGATSESVPKTETSDFKSENSEAQDKSSKNGASIRSEIMKFVRSIRTAADNLQNVLDELKSSINSIPSIDDERYKEWQDMELM